MLMQKLLASVGEESKLYSDDVFQAFTRTGTGADVSVTTGIDMTKGYMLWSKGRSGATDHAIYDSARGLTYDLASNTTAVQTTQATGLKAVSATGHTIGSLAKMNTSAATYVDFVFRKAPKFFDVVTYTGNIADNRDITHSLGQTPGMVIVKSTTNASNWSVWHNSFAANDYIRLNGTDAKNYAGAIASIFGGSSAKTPTPTTFTIGPNSGINASGESYVAYLFAHDPSADGIIQCGSFTTDGSGNATVNLGWEPQYLMFKFASGTSDAVGWGIQDASRNGMLAAGGGQVSYLLANTSGGEASTSSFARATATGFTFAFNANTTYIYLAIRRPNKPPTTGTEVYNHLTRTGSGSVGSTAAVGFAPDLAISQSISAGRAPVWVDRLRGVKKWLRSDGTHEEGTQTTSGLSSFDMLGVSYTVDNTEQPFAWNNSGEAKHQRFFKRAPGFMDVVCYTGNSTVANTPQTVSHSLGVKPEIIILKGRANTDAGWAVGYNFTTSQFDNGYLYGNNASNPIGYNVAFFGAEPTSTTFSVTNQVASTPQVNNSNYNNNTYVAYLFASLPGISKVGNYTGNGTSQTINCGFTTGARFILIKRTDSTGDWYIWDTARGIVAGNDPHLSLNTTATEVTTDDSVDPDVSGFIVNQVAATNINVSGGQCIFLAIA